MDKIKQILSAIKFNKDGLVPAIAQQFDSGEVLMMGWMNEESIRLTLTTKQACYFSRSRNQLWKKGESSGQTQALKAMLIDCDGDTILLKVDQKGVACHTGRRSCFFNEVKDNKIIVNQEVITKPEELYKN